MFSAENGATRTPSRASQRHSPATSTRQLPAQPQQAFDETGQVHSPAPVCASVSRGQAAERTGLRVAPAPKPISPLSGHRVTHANARKA